MKKIEDNNTLVFIVDKRANKKQIEDAVTEMYKDIKALKVNTLITPRGDKKAYVRLTTDYDALDVANKENEQIYLLRVPHSDSLPAISPASLVKGPVAAGAIRGKIEPGDDETALFAGIMPESSTKALSKYTVEADHAVREALSKLNAATDDARTLLATLDLPATLNATCEAPPLEDELAQKVQLARSNGGAAGLLDLQQQAVDRRHVRAADEPEADTESHLAQLAHRLVGCDGHCVSGHGHGSVHLPSAGEGPGVKRACFWRCQVDQQLIGCCCRIVILADCGEAPHHQHPERRIFGGLFSSNLDRFECIICPPSGEQSLGEDPAPLGIPSTCRSLSGDDGSDRLVSIEMRCGHTAQRSECCGVLVERFLKLLGRRVWPILGEVLLTPFDVVAGATSIEHGRTEYERGMGPKLRHDGSPANEFGLSSDPPIRASLKLGFELLDFLGMKFKGLRHSC